jgi:glycosyltransferase involved in cell wall biosynthesis
MKCCWRVGEARIVGLAFGPEIMKVAFIGTRGIPPNYGGSETYVEQLALQLAARGDEIWVYGAPLSGHPELEHRATSYPSSVHRVEIPTLKTKHADNFVRSLLATIHVCFQRRVEVVEFNNMGSALFSFLPRIFGKKVVGSIRAMDSRREKWGFIARIYLRVCERLIYLFPHATTTNSKAIVEYYRERYAVNVHYTPNGAVLPTTPCPPSEILRWGLKGGDYLLFVARLVPEKGCHVLLKAFQQLEWAGMKLVIAGGESFSPDYARALRDDAGDRILFLGHAGGALLDELYANAYAFVLPSSIEGMSNSLLSAMAYGCPVVVSDIPENLAVVEGASTHCDVGQNPALVFHLGDVDDLAARLADLRDNPQDAVRRGACLEAHVRANFSWESSSETTRKIYQELLDH